MEKKLSIIIFILIVAGLILINSKVFASTSNMGNLIAAKMNITNNHLDTSTISARDSLPYRMTFKILENTGTIYCVQPGVEMGGKNADFQPSNPVVTDSSRPVFQDVISQTYANYHAIRNI